MWNKFVEFNLCMYVYIYEPIYIYIYIYINIASMTCGTSSWSSICPYARSWA